MKKIGMFGYGTVGRGFFGLMQRNGDVVSKNAGVELEVCRVFARREFPGDPVEPFLTHRVEDLWEDDSIDIIVEVLAGVEPAYQWTKQALLALNRAFTGQFEKLMQNELMDMDADIRLLKQTMKAEGYEEDD